MENFRYLLATMAALTLILSVVSSVNPIYFAGLNAFAEDNEEEDKSGSSNSNHEKDNDNANRGSNDGKDSEENEDQDELVQSLGNHSKASLAVNESELEIEIEDGDLSDGIYNVTFGCDTPDINKQLGDPIMVEDGNGGTEADLALPNGTYTGCEVNVGDLSAAFPTFTIAGNGEDDENDGANNGKDDDDDENDNESNDNQGRGHNNNASEEDHEDKHEERKQSIVNSTSGTEVHERHRKATPASPGDFRPNWNYTLEANGFALNNTDSANPAQNASANMGIDLSVWKSNRAIILLDVVNGTATIDGQDYNIRIGYAIYSVQHDAMKLVALATDDDGNVFRLKLQGAAANESDPFPLESGSIDLVFGEGQNSTFGSWDLSLKGTVDAS